MGLTIQGFFLAFIVNSAPSIPPEVIGIVEKERQCIAAAEEINRKIEADFPDALAQGVEVVCLKIIRGEEV